MESIKLTLPIPEGSSTLETYGIEIRGKATWLRERTKLYSRFLFKLTYLFLTAILSDIVYKVQKYYSL